MTTALAGTEHHPQARMVLSAALAAGPSHAYLFHGPGLHQPEAEVTKVVVVVGRYREI